MAGVTAQDVFDTLSKRQRRPGITLPESTIGQIPTAADLLEERRVRAAGTPFPESTVGQVPTPADLIEERRARATDEDTAPNRILNAAGKAVADLFRAPGRVPSPRLSPGLRGTAEAVVAVPLFGALQGLDAASRVLAAPFVAGIAAVEQAVKEFGVSDADAHALRQDLEAGLLSVAATGGVQAAPRIRPGQIPKLFRANPRLQDLTFEQLVREAERTGSFKEILRKLPRERRAGFKDFLRENFVRGQRVADEAGVSPAPPPVVPPVEPSLPPIRARGLNLQKNRVILDAIADEIRSGAPGRRQFIETIRGREVVRIASSFPEFFRNKGLSSKEVLGMIEKAQTGKPLTDRQEGILLDLVSTKRQEFADQIRTIRARERLPQDQEPILASTQRGIARGTQQRAVSPDADTPVRPSPTSPAQPGFKPPDTTTERAALKSRRELLEDLTKRLGEVPVLRPFPVRIGIGRARKALGFFRPFQRAIRLKYADDVQTASHEIGHYLDTMLLGGLKGKPVVVGAGVGSTSRSALQRFPLGIRQELFDAGKRLYGDRRPVGGYRAEGFAEFARMFVTEPGTAQALLPETFQWFEPTMRGFDPEILSILLDARQNWQRLQGASSGARILSQISIGERTGRQFPTFSELYTAFLEKVNPLKKFVDAMTEGKPIPAGENPYIVARLYEAGAYIERADSFL
ncbi:MAG: hypothetical protein ACE5JI_11910, partial [Acidobacteriota bacterium]